LLIDAPIPHRETMGTVDGLVALRRLLSLVATVALAVLIARESHATQSWGFDSDVEGWRVVDYPFRWHNPSPGTYPASFDGSFGLPPGSLRIGDVYGETGIAAPDAVLGNRLDLYGGELGYDIFLRFTDNTTYPAVSLNGGSTSVYYDLPSPQINVWEHVTIPLSETGWRVAVSQVPATQTQFESVLSTLTGLYIYTEWHTGADDTNVDNVTLGAMIGLPGDYNQNGVVDAADYVVWRKNPGGIYSPGHYDIWRAHFGQTAGSGALAAIRGPQSNLDRAIPEPAILALLVIGGALLAAPMRRAGSRVTRRGET